MKSSILRPLSLATVLLVATLAGAPTALANPLQNDLVGLWVINGTPNTPQPPPFTNVATVTRNGLTLHKGAIVNVDPELGAGVGTWRYLGGGTYTVTFSGFLQPGVRYVVRSTLNVNGDTVTGPFVTDVLDEFGALLFQYDGLINGNRQGP